MKKGTLITSWALSLALISSISIADAKTQFVAQTGSAQMVEAVKDIERVTALRLQHVQADQMQGRLTTMTDAIKEIEGTVEEIDDFALKVKTEEGSVYTIPIAAFKGLDDFQKLNLQVGSKLSAKKADMLGAVMVSMAEKPLTINITTEKAEAGSLPVINGETLPFTIECKPFNLDTEERDTLRISRPLEALSVVYASSDDIAVEEINREILATAPAEKIAGDVMITRAIKISEEATEGVIKFDNSEIIHLFLAKEIQANGYTVTLPQS